eukprot:TRINITY_DN744_c0_g1_i1.p1 TRINITY_DN744_c0_g1~~TRINITY_DN744_c0_g1_i1.p1  ORF type:complete len:158 (+),score=24.92 TRINITY_DN744_c0_g1_i1:1095-1568(+)
MPFLTREELEPGLLSGNFFTVQEVDALWPLLGGLGCNWQEAYKLKTVQNFSTDDIKLDLLARSKQELLGAIKQSVISLVGARLGRGHHTLAEQELTGWLNTLVLHDHVNCDAVMWNTSEIVQTLSQGNVLFYDPWKNSVCLQNPLYKHHIRELATIQ